MALGSEVLLGFGVHCGASWRRTVGRAVLPAAPGRGRWRLLLWGSGLADGFGCLLGRRGLVGGLFLAGLLRQQRGLLLVELGRGEEAFVGARADSAGLLGWDDGLHGGDGDG